MRSSSLTEINIKKMSRSLSPSLCVAVAIFAVLVGIVEPNIGVIFSYLVGTYCVFRCKLNYLGALFVCHINAGDIEVVTSYIEMKRLDFFSTLNLTERVLPTFGEISAILFCSYFIITICLSRVRFGNSKVRLIFWFWVICVAGGLINSILSISEGHYLWSRGLRAVLTVGCCFYGLLLAQRSKISDDINWANKSIWIVFVPGLLISMHLFWSHLVFWLVSLASILTIVRLNHRNAFLHKVTALSYLPVAIWSSLTLMLISIVTFIVAFCDSSKVKLLKWFAAKVMIFLLILGPIISIILGYIYSILGIFVAPILVSNSSYASIYERVIYKITADRMPIWGGSFKQIIEGDLWFPTSGRIINVLVIDENADWVNGAHNSYLEILRNNGLFFGTILIYIILSLLIMTVKYRTKDSFGYSLLAISLCVTAGVGLVLGDFIVDAGFGGLFWTAVGFTIWRLFYLKGFSHQRLAGTST